ncbi:hypothetical protein [Alteribacter keqinensis]|uniref:Uncharacterized protein n=1 Tax=Alteribacter keqinensis TaxID=2483800 RepID=A0A3M7TNU2_9BACI|nr:hypothetical protein [Alteribacter keqinensis]RNA66275.1 hypothetical protein EBO34_19330 [Alteribacter keqinensis]
MGNKAARLFIILIILPVMVTSFIWLGDVKEGDAMTLIQYAPILLIWIIVAYILLEIYRQVQGYLARRE